MSGRGAGEAAARQTRIPRILAIAGSDSGGGAGIEADIKTISALGGYAMTAITAVTAQNTLGVAGIHTLPPAFVRLAIDTVLGDIGADAIKLGMLGDAPLIAAVAGALTGAVPGGIAVVVDPVMVASSGARLLPESAVAALSTLLVPLATIITPNLPEAEVLTGIRITGPAEARAAAEALRAMGAAAVLIKGGHGEGDEVVDLLIHAGGAREFRNKRIATRNTHGTGCTLASAIATGLGAGMTLPEAVERAIGYVQRAIARAPGFGSGHGPLGHWLP